MTNPTFDSYRSDVDDVQVVHVDTHDMPENKQGPIIRVYLNESVLFENPKYPGYLKRTVVPKQSKRESMITDHLPIVHRTREIVVTVKGGLVEDVTNIPPGTVVKVIDLDDESEEKCLITFWGKD